MSVEGEIMLQPAPADGVASVRFAPSTNLLMVSCWDATMLLYDASGAGRLLCSLPVGGPALDSCFLDNSHAVGVGLDQTIRMYDLNDPGHATVLGQHAAAIKCANYSPQTNTLFTGGWDSKVHAWDPRRAGTPSASLEVPGKVFSMDLSDTRLLAATAGRRIACYDVRHLGGGAVFERESSLKYQTRSLRFFPDGDGFAVASIEGRVAIEYLDPEW
jgi:cell cycle arrest protein BUB3